MANVQKIIQKEVGGSTLAARKIWYDTIVGRLNDEGRGKFLGSFKGSDRILTLYKSGEYRLSSFDLANHFDEDMIHIEKWVPRRPISTVYFDAEKEMHYVKRFLCEITSDKKVLFISETEGSYMDLVSTSFRPEVRVIYNKLLKRKKGKQVILGLHKGLGAAVVLNKLTFNKAFKNKFTQDKND